MRWWHEFIKKHTVKPTYGPMYGENQQQNWTYRNGCGYGILVCSCGKEWEVCLWEPAEEIR